jgi:RimJ/RimL family protein N-acetyltransferase
MSDPLPWPAERVVVRRLGAGDLVRFQAYRHDPEVGRWQGWEPQSDEQSLAFLEEMAVEPFGRVGEWIQLAIADAHDDRLLGDIGLHLREPDGSEAELGITLAGDTQGRGLATEAAEAVVAGLRAHTGVRRLVGITDVRNTPSARLLERLGMELEREEDGEWYYAMGL